MPDKSKKKKVTSTSSSKSTYAPYGSSNINIEPNGYATTKPFPKTMERDTVNGKPIVRIRDSAKKILFSGEDETKVGDNRKDHTGRKMPTGSKATSSFTRDSISHQNTGHYQAGKKNQGQAIDDAYQNAIKFVGKKKK